MATLAQDLLAKGIQLQDPFEKNKELLQKFKEQGTPAQPKEKAQDQERRESTEILKVVDNNSSEDKREELTDLEDEEDEVEDKVMPRSVKKQRQEVESPTGGLSSGLSKLSMTNLSPQPKLPRQTIMGWMPCPMLSATWEDWDPRDDSTRKFCIMRLHIINGIEIQEDIKLSWVDPFTFKVKMRWPKYMTDYQSMTKMDAFEDGGNCFPDGHQVFVSMGKNAKMLKDDEGSVWSEGLFQFERKMEARYEPHVIHLPDNYGLGNILQVKFIVKSNDDELPFTSPILSKRAGLSKLKPKSEDEAPKRRRSERPVRPPVPEQPSSESGGWPGLVTSNRSSSSSSKNNDQPPSKKLKTFSSLLPLSQQNKKLD